jgi:hypothetical protein
MEFLGRVGNFFARIEESGKLEEAQTRLVQSV